MAPSRPESRPPPRAVIPIVVIVFWLVPGLAAAGNGTALSRAEAAVGGLYTYYFQTEAPTRRVSDCPCFRCPAGQNCSQETGCAYCASGKDSCGTTGTCYTSRTDVDACVCDSGPGPVPKPARFYFTCGQIGGLDRRNDGGGSPDTCVCENDYPYLCLNCYRWWSAVALEASASYAIAAGLNGSQGEGWTILTAAESMWAHAPYNGFWNATAVPVFIDDFSWYGLAYMRVWDWTRDPVWLERAAAIYDWAILYGWDARATASSGSASNGSTGCGGFWWNLEEAHHFKDSISIAELVHIGARLGAEHPVVSKRAAYLASAERTWAWLYTFDDGRGLVAENGIMSTGAQPEWCCGATSAAAKGSGHPGDRCANSQIPGMTYNHGLLMSATATLYAATGSPKYLAKADALLAAAFANLTESDGSVLDQRRGSEQSSDACASGSDPGSDFFSFKGIYVANLAYFGQTLQTAGKLTAATHWKLLSMVRQSSDNAWAKSAVRPPFQDGDDVCNASGWTHYTRRHATGLAVNPSPMAHRRQQSAKDTALDARTNPAGGCPAPSVPKYTTVGQARDCHAEDPSSCVDGSNTAHRTLAAAWSACWSYRECAVIMLYRDGAFYLRRNDDPVRALAGAKLLAYTCKRPPPPPTPRPPPTPPPPPMPTFPKFHWWWSRGNATAQTPPDPRMWYTKRGLNCAYSGNTTAGLPMLLWAGSVGSEAVCQGRCGNDTQCTKYTFRGSSAPALSGAATADCRLFREAQLRDRSKEGCTTMSRSVIVGAKRPSSDGSCKATCALVDRQVPAWARQKQEATALAVGVQVPGHAGPGCYCDDECTRHMDCCLDFAHECTADKYQAPTCRGRCAVGAGRGGGGKIGRYAGQSGGTALAVAIQGGGYCYCDDQCDPGFTDNNSYGSCCADWASLCGGAPRDGAPCMDARTQASAVNLFVAHHNIEALSPTGQ